VLQVRMWMISVRERTSGELIKDLYFLLVLILV